MARSKHTGLKFLIGLGVLGGAAYGAHRAGWTEGIMGEEEVAVLEGAPVRRGDLRISEVVKGNLEAKDSASIRSQLEGRSTILYLEKEGAKVEKGQLVAELDVSTIEDEKVRQDIAVQQAELDVTQAQKALEIQIIQNKTDLAAANLEVELARLDLEKYLDEKDGDWTLELAKAEEAVKIQQEEYARAVTELEWTQKLADEGFIQLNQLESDRLAKQRSEIELEQAKRELESKKKFGNVRKLAELNAEVENRKSLLEKTEKQAESKLADNEATLESATYKLAREKEKQTKLVDQIGKGKLYAPESGLLVYSREQGRMGNTEVIQEGQEVRERQELMTIPRAGGMVAKASIHETKLKKITTGMPCLITVEAFPNRVFNGRVDFVAVMADSGSWRTNPNTRLYKAEIGLFDAIPEMRPGMSCNVEILIEDLKDVLYVPRQCVLLDGAETIVFVQEGGVAVRRKVTVGLDNTKWVVVQEGVKEGEMVLLAPPASFDPAPAPEQMADPNAGPAGVGGAAAPAGMPAGAAGPSGRPAPSGDVVGGGAANGAPQGGPEGGASGRPRSGFDRTQFLDADGKPDLEKMRAAGFDPERMRGGNGDGTGQRRGGRRGEGAEGAGTATEGGGAPAAAEGATTPGGGER